MGLIARPDAPKMPPSAPELPPRPKDGEPEKTDPLHDTREAAFHVGGMWCAACGWLIENALGKTRGVTGCRVFFASDVVKITYRPARLDAGDLVAVIQRLGYSAEPFTEEGGRPNDPAARARRMSLTRTVIAPSSP